MKKTLLIVLFLIVSTFSNAHTINHPGEHLKTWTLVNHQRIEGSIHLIKNGLVYIEDEHNNVQPIPFSSFSKADLEFIHKKEVQIANYNNIQIDPINNNNSNNYSNDLFLVFSVIGLLLFLASLIVFPQIKDQKGIPALMLGILIFFLASFTSFPKKLLQVNTSPLFLDSAFTPFKPNIATHWDSTWFYVESNGIPTTHPMMAGITAWQQQVPIPQCYTGNNAWMIPLNPVISANPIPVNPAHFSRGAIALAVNGIPIFNPYTNTGVDAFLDGQLDNWGGHCGRGDDYHYHIAPMTLYNQLPATAPLAFALDGFAVYGTVEPDGSALAPLDTNNGHFGANGVYHYHGVSAAPYMIAKMVGQVTEDTTHQIIPQPHANPVRPALTPLQGAIITSCTPNTNGNGYNLTYTHSGQTDSVVYSWNNTGHFTFNFYTNSGVTTQNYNGTTPCFLNTGLNTTSSINQVAIYPNPTHDYFKILPNESFNKNNVVAIKIFNTSGALVMNTTKYIDKVSTSSLRPGVYIIKIELHDTTITKKLVVE